MILLRYCIFQEIFSPERDKRGLESDFVNFHCQFSLFDVHLSALNFEKIQAVSIWDHAALNGASCDVMLLLLLLL